MKKTLMILCVVTLVIGMVGTVSALTINQTETWGTGSTSSKSGLATLNSTSVDGGWVKIQSNSGATNRDIGYNDSYSNGSSNAGDRFMWLKDDYVIAANIDTTGYDTIAFGFDWRTYRAERSDRLRVGYAISATLPLSWSNFTPLDMIKSNTWTTESYALLNASDTTDLWVSFFMDAGSGDYGFVDNVLISGVAQPTPNPEPTTIALFGIGILGLAGVEARRKWKKKAVDKS